MVVLIIAQGRFEPLDDFNIICVFPSVFSACIRANFTSVQFCSFLRNERNLPNVRRANLIPCSKTLYQPSTLLFILCDPVKTSPYWFYNGKSNSGLVRCPNFTHVPSQVFWWHSRNWITRYWGVTFPEFYKKRDEHLWIASRLSSCNSHKFLLLLGMSGLDKIFGFTVSAFLFLHFLYYSSLVVCNLDSAVRSFLETDFALSLVSGNLLDVHKVLIFGSAFSNFVWDRFCLVSIWTFLSQVSVVSSTLFFSRRFS